VITQPDWLRRPTGDDVQRYFPRKARKAGVEGRAVLTCSVTAEGLLANCQVSDETPPDYGFGETARKLIPLFKMRPTTRDGVAVPGGTVRIPLRFYLPDR
jgi:protein TonB